MTEAPALLRAEYLNTPTLLLTAGDVANMLDLDRVTALAALEALEDSGFLELTPAGLFGRSAGRYRAVTGAPLIAKPRAV